MTEAGPRYNGRTAPELATDAEESVLGISHLVEAYEVPLSVETIYRTLSALTRLVEQTPRTVTLLSEAVKSQRSDPGFTIGSGPFAGDPDAAVDAMQQAVTDLLTAFGPVRTALDATQAAVSDARSTDPTG